MKIDFLKYTVLALMVLAAAACRDDDTDGIDTALRVSLSPEPEIFAADGRTESGEESFVAVVTLNAGSSPCDMEWIPEIGSGAEWASVTTTTVASDFYETWSGAVTTVSEKAVEVKVAPNTEYRRRFTMLIRTADGTAVPFEFTQLGEKADAAVTADTERIEFVAAGGSQSVAFESNMGDVCGFSATYDEMSADWLTWQSAGTGTVTLAASQWTDKTTPRTATFTITVGSDDTSKASFDIAVTQLAEDDYYYMYGASCDALPIEQAIQLTKNDVGVYSGNAYFMASGDGRNPVLINRDSRTLSYPCYCLAADGTVAEIASADAAVPSGPEIDVDGRRTFVVDFNGLTWTWTRITTPNCMPDSEVANYRTKSYVARDGSMKTWMIDFVRWDGGDISPKLGSVMVPSATGAGAAGTGGYTAANFPASWNASTLNMDYETTEIGGKLVGTSERGRIYHFEEMVTGTPRYGIGYARYEPLPDGWTAGSTIVDAVGRSFEVEYIVHTAAGAFSGDNAADEAAHPMLTMQVQGICPYGWHIANTADWLDLAWAACKASAGHTYPMQEDQITYKQLTTTTGTATVNNPVSPRGIGNFAPWLRNSEWGAGAISDGADEFGFNYYPLGWRYMTQGFQCAGSRCQTWVPLCYSSAAAFRINVLINNTVTYVEMANLDNGQAICPFRCVKNYK